MKRYTYLTLLFFCVFGVFGFNRVFAQSSQKEKVDSLWQIVQSEDADTTILKATDQLLKLHYYSGDTTKFQEVIVEVSPLLKAHDKFVARIKNWQGYFAFKYQKDPLKGEKFIQEAIDIQEEKELWSDLANSYLGLGISFKRSAIYKEALNYYFKSIEIFEQEDDLMGVGNAYNNIANVFSLIKDRENAIKYHHLSLDYRIKDGNPQMINISYLGLGLEYQEMKDFDSAVYYLTKTIEETDAIGQFGIKAVAVSSLGILYADFDDYEKALPLYQEALFIRDSIGDVNGIHTSKLNLGELYLNHDFNPEIKQYCSEAYDYANANNDLVMQQRACGCLSKYYSKAGDFKRA